MESVHSRRGLLKAAGSLIPLAWTPLAALASPGSSPRHLHFHHLHTGERLRVTYAENGRYVPQAFEAIDHLLRDFRCGEIHPIDPRLLDILHEVRQRTAGTGAFEVISGYRSPATNDMLRRSSSGVSRTSLHLSGQAIDVRLAGIDTGHVRRAALAVRRGGVGYYPESDFVHLDTGRVRTW